MGSFLQTLVNGFVTGGFYALLGSGLSIIWGTLQMVNLAHGDFYMLGAFLMYMFACVIGINAWVAIGLSVISMFLISAFLETLLIRPLVGKPDWEKTPFVITVGVSIFLQNFALRIWGERYKSVPYLNEDMINIFGIRLVGQRAIILIIAVVAIFGLMLFVKKNRVGWAIRATSQNIQAATLVGIDTKRIYLITFALAGALCALAGCLLAPIYGVNPWMGARVQMKAFVVCVLGGLGSLEGSIVAGFLLGTVESFSVDLISSEWKDLLSYVILIIVLWVKPTGLFGKKQWR